MGDGADPGVSLTHELHRPLLSYDSEGSLAIRKLFQTDQVEVEAFANETCVRLVRDAVQELNYLTSKPEVGDTLRQRLNHVTGPEARDLVSVWKKMVCRNGSLVEFSPVLTRLLNCNTAPLLLGAGQSAKGAGLYMAKYMTKDSYKLQASLSVLLDARQHIKDYPTQAEDAGTSTRTTQHFLQRVLNSTTAELAPTQAAAIVLGMPSAAHSHTFVYACVWDAIRLIDVLRGGGAFLADPAPPPEPEHASGEESAGDTSTESASDDGFESEGELEPSAAAAKGRTGGAGVYTLPDGTKIPVANVEHYAYRDPLLHMMSFDEYVMAFKVEKVKPEEMDAINDPHPAAGRPRQRAYRFQAPHPLRECYVLKEKAKFEVPIFTGDPPPRLPAAGAGGKPRCAGKMAERAAFYGALFIPWHAGGAIDVSPAAWAAHVSSLEATAARQTSVPKELLQRDVAQGRLFRIRNVANALVANAQKAKLMSKWRSRNRDLWAAPKDEAETKGGRRAAGSDEPADAATRKEIEELQNSAPRPKDGSPELLGGEAV